VHAIHKDTLTSNVIKNNELKIYLLKFIGILVEGDSGLSAYKSRRNHGFGSQSVAREELF